MTTKKLPDNWWDKKINPVLGYRYQPLQDQRPPRNKFEYNPEDDIKL